MKGGQSNTGLCMSMWVGWGVAFAVVLECIGYSLHNTDMVSNCTGGQPINLLQLHNTVIHPSDHVLQWSLLKYNSV